MRGERISTEGQSACVLEGAEFYGEARSPDLPDWCTPLDEPVWVTPSEASLMRDEDPVLGFEAAERIWAIPWWVIKNHHVANLMLEGQPFLVTLCEACVGGGVFHPMLGGARAMFQTIGWYRGSPLMTDDLTGSLWALINGHCVAGPSEGVVLPMRPIVHARWHEWAALHPQTLVVHGEGEPRDGHGAECWGPDHQMMGGDRRPQGIGMTELMVGVELGEARRAYQLATVHELGGIVEDTLNDTPIVVVTRPGTWLCVAFVREFEGTPIRLEWDRAEDPPSQLVDRVAGRRFDLWGRCLTDERRGVRLPYVRSSLEKWRAWVIANPDTDLWQPGRAQATTS